MNFAWELQVANAQAIASAKENTAVPPAIYLGGRVLIWSLDDLQLYQKAMASVCFDGDRRINALHF